MEYNVEVKREWNRTLLRFKIPGLYTEDYQFRMIKENGIRGFLPVSARGEEGWIFYEYEITGFVSMASIYKQKKITGKEMRQFLIQMQTAIEEAENYLLDSDCLLLEPDYIFQKGEEYRFCYFPQGTDEIRMTFHRLMEHFVQWTDYQDIPSVKTAFLLHKETMEENYSLGQLVRKLEEIGETEEKMTSDTAKNEEILPEEVKKAQREVWETSEYDRTEDWTTRQEMGARLLKETDNLWTPVKKLLQRHKRPKWGEWDGIYIEEEEL